MLYILCTHSDLPALRHSMIYEYGSYLMTSHNMWQLGIDYLDCCKQEGQAAIELLLPRITLRSERQATKLINLARQRGLISVEREICKVLSKRSYDNERYGNALEWAIRSKDVLLVTAVADFILKVNINHFCISISFNLICILICGIALLENWLHALPGHHCQCRRPNVCLAALGVSLQVL